MPKNNLDRIAGLNRQIAQLEAKRDQIMRADLAALPEQFGFASAAEFCAAVQGSAGKRAPSSGRAPAAGAAGKTRAKRAIITDQTRSEVKRMTEAGKTGAEVAKACGISLPSVQNIKKALGLVKSRS